MQDIARQGQYYHKGTTLQQGTTNKNYQQASALSRRREKSDAVNRKGEDVSSSLYAKMLMWPKLFLLFLFSFEKEI